MQLGPNLSIIAALIADPARCSMLTTLLSGQALTNGELAREAGVTLQTASFHIGKLRDGGLIESSKSGRHRYNMLAGPHVGEALEALLNLAERAGARRFQPGPKEPALRKARICYDHLAGDMGVLMFDRLLALGALEMTPGGDVVLGATSGPVLDAIGLNPGEAKRSSTCRTCMDWSVRRWHLAGPLAAGILCRLRELRWLSGTDGSRVLDFTPAGEKRFRRWLESDSAGIGAMTAVAARPSRTRAEAAPAQAPQQRMYMTGSAAASREADRTPGRE